MAGSRIPALITYGALGYFAAFLVGMAYADHMNWPIVNEKQLVKRSKRAAIHRDVECCTDLRAPLPRIAKVAGWPCPWDAAKICLDGSIYQGWYEGTHQTVILPIGNDTALRHEFIHHQKHIDEGDGDFDHNGPGWACE